MRIPLQSNTSVLNTTSVIPGYNMVDGMGLLLGAAGGIVLGLSTTLWLHTSGQVTGISGFVRGLIDPARVAKGGVPFKAAWLSAFMAVAATVSLVAPSWVAIGNRPDASVAGYIIGGFFVGIGTSMSNGCTSGHGICGLARFSLRSLTAVLTFMLAAMLTATAVEVNRPAFLVQVPTSVPGLAAMSGVPNAPTPIFAMVVIALCGVIAVGATAFSAWGVSAHEGAHTAMAVAAGAVFAGGMAVGGMMNRGTILEFLALTPQWNPQLAFVMGGGVVVAVAAFWWVRVRNAAAQTSCPAMGEGLTPDERQALTFLQRKYQVPTNTLVNFELVLGAALFGVGWGISGLCPGPALGLMASGHVRVWLWLVGFALGVWGWIWLEHSLAVAGANSKTAPASASRALVEPATPTPYDVASAVLKAASDNLAAHPGAGAASARSDPGAAACGPDSMQALQAALAEDVRPVLCAALLQAANAEGRGRVGSAASPVTPSDLLVNAAVGEEV